MTNKRKSKQNFLNKNPLGVIAGIIVFCVILVKLYLLDNKITQTGLGFYVTLFSFFSIFYLVIGRTIGEVVEKMILYRKSRAQYKNIKKAIWVTSAFSFLAGVLIAAVLVLFSVKITAVLFGMLSYGTYISVTLAAAIPFLFLCSSLSGVFKGYGFLIPVSISKIIFAFFDLLLSLLLVFLFTAWGKEHAAIIHDDTIICSFGAIGAGLAFLLSLLFSTIWMLVLSTVIKNNVEKQFKNDVSRSTESAMDMIRVFFHVCPSPLAKNMILYGTIFLNCMIVFLNGDNKGAMLSTWMVYSVCCIIWFELPVNYALEFYSFQSDTIHKIMKRDDIYHASQRIVFSIKQFLCVILPLILVFGILTKPLFGKLFSGVDLKMVEFTALSVSLVCFAFLCLSLVSSIGKGLVGALSGLCAIALQSVLLWFMSKKEITLSSLMLVNSVFALTIVVICGVFLLKFCVYHKKPVKNFVFPFLCAVGLGLLMKLVTLLCGSMGNLLGVFVAVVLYVFLHPLLLIVSGSIGEMEAEEFPQAPILKLWGKTTGIF